MSQDGESEGPPGHLGPSSWVAEQGRRGAVAASGPWTLTPGLEENAGFSEVTGNSPARCLVARCLVARCRCPVGVSPERAAPQPPFNRGEPDGDPSVWIPATGSHTLAPEGNFLAFSHINIICKYF